MGGLSIWHWLIVLVVVLILFGGGGKLSRLMGDMAQGIKAFKKGLKEPDSVEPGSDEPKVINAEAVETTGEAAKKDQAAKS
jgi:sec-independent protein translocase protein TatA